MTNFTTKTAIALAAGVMAASIMLPTVASASNIDTNVLYYDWQFKTVSTDGETIAANIVVGLQYNAIYSDPGAPNTPDPYAYDVLSATGSVTFSGNVNETVAITGLVPATDATTPSDQIFFQQPLPLLNDGFLFNNAGVGVFLSTAGLDLATALPGLDVGLNYTSKNGTNYYQLVSLDSTGASGDNVLPGTITADNPDGTTFESISNTTQTLTQVPEPGAIALIGAALLGMAWFRRRTQSAAI